MYTNIFDLTQAHIHWVSYTWHNNLNSLNGTTLFTKMGTLGIIKFYTFFKVSLIIFLLIWHKIITNMCELASSIFNLCWFWSHWLLIFQNLELILPISRLSSQIMEHLLSPWVVSMSPLGLGVFFFGLGIVDVFLMDALLDAVVHFTLPTMMLAVTSISTSLNADVKS